MLLPSNRLWVMMLDKCRFCCWYWYLCLPLASKWWCFEKCRFSCWHWCFCLYWIFFVLCLVCMLLSLSLINVVCLNYYLFFSLECMWSWLYRGILLIFFPSGCPHFIQGTVLTYHVVVLIQFQEVCTFYYIQYLATFTALCVLYYQGVVKFIDHHLIA